MDSFSVEDELQLLKVANNDNSRARLCLCGRRVRVVAVRAFTHRG